MFVLKLHLFLDLQEKVGELIISIISYPTIVILENALSECIEKRDYGNFDHRYNVSPIHLHAILGVGNFTKMVSMCADRL
jgi:hypothetical protein